MPAVSPLPMTAAVPRPTPLLRDELTSELVIKAREGNRDAVEALFARSLPRLTRWAHGRLPRVARGALDTGDLVQETVSHALRRLDTFEPRHVGAMQAYLRQSVVNRIRDELRRIGRHAPPVSLPEDLSSKNTSPLDTAIAAEFYARYRAMLGQLTRRDRELVVARVEAQRSFPEIAEQLGLPSTDAARMAVSRALRRLTEALGTAPR